MRTALDRLYQLSGAIAALCIVTIAALVSTQVVFNLITKMGLFGVNLTIPSYADFSGYLLAGASFFGLSYTLVRGGHIRVTLLLGAVAGRVRHVLELVTLATGFFISAAASYFTFLLNYQSFVFDDRSSGIVSIPIWIVQLPMSVGLSILTIAFADLFVSTLATGRRQFPDVAGVE